MQHSASELKNIFYNALITKCEAIERGNLYVRNGHHLAQVLVNDILIKLYPLPTFKCAKCGQKMAVRSSTKKNGFIKRYLQCISCKHKEIFTVIENL